MLFYFTVVRILPDEIFLSLEVPDGCDVGGRRAVDESLAANAINRQTGRRTQKNTRGRRRRGGGGEVRDRDFLEMTFTVPQHVYVHHTYLLILNAISPFSRQYQRRRSKAGGPQSFARLFLRSKYREHSRGSQ